jgi:diguanylate cyclase (GGDEF)-like protein
MPALRGVTAALTRDPDVACGRAPIWTAVGALVATLAWFAVNATGPWGPAALGWIPSAVAMAAAGVAGHRTAHAPGLPAGAVRFWRDVGLVGTLCAVGLVIRAGYILPRGSEPGAASLMPWPTMAFSIGAAALGVWALLRVPVGRMSYREWLRLLLDTLTVVLGAGLVMWYFSLGPLVDEARSSSVAVWSPFFVAALCLIGVSAAAKIVLVGGGPVDMGALKLNGAGLLIGGLSAGSASVLADSSQLVPGQVGVPVIALLMCFAARRQAVVTTMRAAHTSGRLRSIRRPARRPARPYSLLPYAALLATDALLLMATLPKADLRSSVVVIGVVVVTLVVAFRQLAAFTDNARLVDQLRRQEDRLRHQAGHDSLTQLANRSVFAGALDAALNGDPGVRLAVLLIDLDDFKSVNDTLGHAVGDQLLLGVAGRLEECIRREGMVARLGGDEFGVLLRDAEPDTAEAMAARILASLAAPVIADEHQLLVRASIGVAVAQQGDGSGTLLRNADIAMYAAKERGKGNYLRYVPGMATNVLEHARLGAQLREAIAAGQLYPVFQPVVHLLEHRIIGMETLVRWDHPVRGAVPPVRFIPTAERTGLVVPMGRWLIDEAFNRLAAWQREYGSTAPRTIGVNVSGRQLAEPAFAADTAAAVLSAGLQPHNVVLEVTEDSVLTGRGVIETLRELHDFGIKIALDDFGTGQSSLGLLRSCPVDILKLDKSFVDGIGEGTQQAAIASAVVAMAQALDLDAVAEGIENDAQAEFLTHLGYRLGQGFHLVPPLPGDEIVRLFGNAVIVPGAVGHSRIVPGAVGPAGVPAQSAW